MITMNMNDLYVKVRIPEKYWGNDITLDKIYNNMDESSKKSIELFLDRKSLGLFIIGSSGCGKTALVSTLLKEMIVRRIQCFRGDIAHFAQSFRENDWAISPKYVQPTVIAIDDIDKVPHGKQSLKRVGPPFGSFCRLLFYGKQRVVLIGKPCLNPSCS